MKIVKAVLCPVTVGCQGSHIKHVTVPMSTSDRFCENFAAIVQVACDIRLYPSN